MGCGWCVAVVSDVVLYLLCSWYGFVLVVFVGCLCWIFVSLVFVFGTWWCGVILVVVPDVVFVFGV
jgi:hypothetical protein